MSYKYTNNWHQTVQGFWDEILGNFDITKVLEIGSYEGQSACYLANRMSYGDIYCVDNWLDCEPQKKSINFSDVESKFDYCTQRLFLIKMFVLSIFFLLSPLCFRYHFF